MSSIESIVAAEEKLYALITKEYSDQSSKKYNNDQWTLSELDKWRVADLPELLKGREKPYLTKEELKLLMDWKLAKGKFRPTLPKLINSNDESSVEAITQEGIKCFLDGLNAMGVSDWQSIDTTEYKSIIKSALKELCKLRGVGPATASLILSLLCDISTLSPPFFSDEAFMYYVRDALRPSNPIKYNVKEYVDEFIPIFLDILRKRSPPTAAQTLERGAWSLKSYQIHRIDRLASVKLPFSITEECLDRFSDSQKILGSVNSAASVATTEKKVSNKRSLSAPNNLPSKKSKTKKLKSPPTA